MEGIVLVWEQEINRVKLPGEFNGDEQSAPTGNEPQGQPVHGYFPILQPTLGFSI
jgi:hypothetical protein